MDTPFLIPLGILFLLCTSDQLKNTHKLCRGPSTEHSYQWFQRRRLKCKSLWKTMTTTTDDGHQVMAIPHMTPWVG